MPYTWTGTGFGAAVTTTPFGTSTFLGQPWIERAADDSLTYLITCRQTTTSMLAQVIQATTEAAALVGGTRVASLGGSGASGDPVSVALPGTSKFLLGWLNGTTFRSNILTRSGTSLTVGALQSISLGSGNGDQQLPVFAALSSTRVVAIVDGLTTRTKTWRIFDISGDTITLAASGTGPEGTGAATNVRLWTIDSTRVLVRAVGASDNYLYVMNVPAGASPTVTYGTALNPATLGPLLLVNPSTNLMHISSKLIEYAISGDTVTQTSERAVSPLAGSGTIARLTDDGNVLVMSSQLANARAADPGTGAFIAGESGIFGIRQPIHDQSVIFSTQDSDVITTGRRKLTPDYVSPRWSVGRVPIG